MIVNADVLAWARSYDGPKFHACLTDPPYELGFMGKGWDSQGVAFDPATWAAIASTMHPGAFGMAFASSRGWHRLACAIEDAGLRIHPSVFLWANGSGFPKATRVKDAPDFGGHRYGGQALKPAVEPIIVWQVPYAGKPRDCIVATGAGALWVDGGRVATGESWAKQDGESGAGFKTGKFLGANGIGEPTQPNGFRQSTAGRWPPNFALVHSPACNGTCAPECPVRRLGEQSGELHGHGSARHRGSDAGIFSVGEGDRPQAGGESGNCSRFFPNPDYSLDIAERIAAADPVCYTAKASRRERSAGLPDGQRSNHPTVKPLSISVWLATLLLPPDAYAPRRLLVPFAGSGSECIGAMLAGWEEIVAVEREAEYVAIAEARLAWWAANRDKAPKVRAMERAEPRHSGEYRIKGGRLCAIDAAPPRTNSPAPAPMLPGMEAAP